MIAIRNSVHSFVKKVSTPSKIMKSIIVDSLGLDKNMIIRAIYIPPHNSRYSDMGHFQELVRVVLDNGYDE